MEVLIPITLFAMIAAIVIVPRYLKSQERIRLQETLRVSIEKGAPLPPEVLEAIMTDVKPAPSSARDLRKGIIWLAVGVGLAAIGLAISFEEPDAFMVFLGFAALPAFIGLAFILISAIGHKRP